MQATGFSHKAYYIIYIQQIQLSTAIIKARQDQVSGNTFKRQIVSQDSGRKTIYKVLLTYFQLFTMLNNLYSCEYSATQYSNGNESHHGTPEKKVFFCADVMACRMLSCQVAIVTTVHSTEAMTSI